MASSKKGELQALVRQISEGKGEPQWMLRFRLQSLEQFFLKKLPEWGPDLSQIDFGSLKYYSSLKEGPAKKWQDVPDEVKQKYQELGIPQDEQRLFAGVGAQYDSESVYHEVREAAAKQGVIFLDTDTALREHPALFKKYFSKIVPAADNAFAALNSALWSGGSFVYVPKGAKVRIPLSAFFLIAKEGLGQFERTLIVADEGSQVHYIEGCTAPRHSIDALHAAVVEVLVLPKAHVRYTTVQNWSKNVYNLVTKRARVEEDALVEWVDGNIGSKVTMKYPGMLLAGRNARADVLSVSMAGKGQVQDTGAKIHHLAPGTRASVVSKSVSYQGGISSYRGQVSATRWAKGSRTSVKCDALLMDKASQANTYPAMDAHGQAAQMEHEAKVSCVGEKELFYLQSRGFGEEEAASLLVAGFMEPFAKELPGEYAIELNRLIKMEMENSVG